MVMLHYAALARSRTLHAESTARYEKRGPKGPLSLSKKVTNRWPFSRERGENMVEQVRMMNVLTKNIENRGQVEFVSLEQMVPADHLLRQIDAAIDFHKIYEFVGDSYCKDNGRPSIDPVVLFRIVVQNCADPAYLRHPFSAPNAGRNQYEYGGNLCRWYSYKGKCQLKEAGSESCAQRSKTLCP